MENEGMLEESVEKLIISAGNNGCRNKWWTDDSDEKEPQDILPQLKKVQLFSSLSVYVLIFFLISIILFFCIFKDYTSQIKITAIIFYNLFFHASLICHWSYLSVTDSMKFNLSAMFYTLIFLYSRTGKDLSC